MSASAERVAPGQRERNAQAGITPVGETAVSQPLDRVCTFLAAAGIILLAIRRWTLVGSFPPGLDGAQWLALGRGLNRQAIGRPTGRAYAPLTPPLFSVAQ